MSTDLVQKTKSFWSRPEGKSGMIALAGLGGLVFYGWGKIVPFVVATLANTLHAMLLVGAIAGLLYFSPRIILLFKLAMRALTGLIIELDPIGILKQRCAELMKRLDTFYEQMKSLRGAVRTIVDNIDKNRDEIEKQKRIASNARRVAESPGGDEIAQLRAQNELRVSMNEITRLTTANEKYEKLRLTLDRIHRHLQKMSLYLEGYVKDAQNEARQQEIQRKAIRAGHKALSSAIAVIRGKADENDIYNQTLEFLADDASQKLGEMDENLRFAEDFMAKVDLQSGGISDDALKMLEEFEQKMLPPASIKTSLPASKALVEVVRDGEKSKFFK